MKKILLPILIFALFFFIGCGSSQKSVTDNDPCSDGDTDDTEISDEDEPDGSGQETNIPDKDKPNGEETETDEPDDDENDTDTVKKDYCARNICEKIENSTGKCISGEKDYSCECRENYTWEGYAWEGPRCKADQRKEKCSGLPEHAQWTTVSEITQTWNGEVWEPSETAVFSEETAYNRCYFKCIQPYAWNGEECAGSCGSDTCKDVPHSTGVCFNATSGRYICECEENYWWWGERRGCITQRPALANICTGIYTCYDNSKEIECPYEEDEAFYGQDAYYAKLGFCSPRDFVVNSEFHGESIVVNRNAGLEWYPLPNDSYSWNEAAEACGKLSYAGKNDWRLPKLREIMSISAVTDADMELNELYFPLQYPTVWASELFRLEGQHSWALSISTGVTAPLFNNYNQPGAVCVRGEEYPESVFESSTINGDEVITDSASGLMWQKDYTVKDSSVWKEALSYCENLVYAGYSDWRLPNKNELASLVNYERYRPAADLPISQMRDSLPFLSSTNTDYAVYSVDFTYGEVKGVAKSDGNFIAERYIRCVRSDI